MQVRTLLVGGIAVAALVVVTRERGSPRVAKAAPSATVAKAEARAQITLPALPRVRDATIDVEIEEPYYTEPEDDEVDDVVESDTYGGVRGVVRDRATGEPLPGVTVIATTPANDGAQAVITDEHGYYEITTLPPGSYVVTMYYVDVTTAYPLVEVEAGRATPVFARLDYKPLPPPVIEEHGHGITIDLEYVRDIPVVERTFEEALHGTGLDDRIEVEFSGGTLLENEYIIE